jgi:hypothetical protein
MILKAHAAPSRSGTAAREEHAGDRRLRTARILFCGGGTGGHLMPAVTLARAAEEKWPGLETRFLVAGRAAEEPFFRDRPASAIPLFAGSARRPALWRLDRYVAACWRTRHEVHDWRADLVVLLGGYVALAALAAGRVPLVCSNRTWSPARPRGCSRAAPVRCCSSGARRRLRSAVRAALPRECRSPTSCSIATGAPIARRSVSTRRSRSCSCSEAARARRD